MPKHTGAVFVVPPVADYDDGQSDVAPMANTLKRLKACGQQEKAMALMRSALADKLTGDKVVDRKLKGLWLRTHFPPRAVLDAQLQQQGAPKPLENPPASELSGVEFTPVNPSEPLRNWSDQLTETAENPTVDEAVNIHQESVPALKAPRLALSGALETLLPADKTCELELDLPPWATPEEELRQMRWVRSHLFDVQNGRVALRSVPFKEARWLCELALSNPTAFESKYLDKLLDYDAKRTAAQEAELKARRDDDLDISDLLTELEKAESAENARLLPLCAENPGGEPEVSSEAD